MSIAINNQQNLHSLFTTKKTALSTEKISTVPSNNDAIDTKPSSLQNVKGSRNISNIKPAEVKAHYESIKNAARKELDETNFENKKLEPYDYHNATIDKIMDVPLKVEIDRDEVYTAILYSRIGISFLDVKEVEMRMEVLNLAQEKINEDVESGAIRRDQHQKLSEKIENNLNHLEKEKQSILDRTSGDESEEVFLEQVKQQRKMVL